MTSDGSNQSRSVVILAAGAGVRMNSNLPKPLHEVGGRPMLLQVLLAARELDPVDITIVGSPDLQHRLASVSWADDVSIAIQDPPRGTADAVRIAIEQGATGATVLVLYADHPLVTAKTLALLLNRFDRTRHRLGVMTCMVGDAAGYGRIDRDAAGRMRAIVEKVDDDKELRKGVTEINSGFMVLDRTWAQGALAMLRPNPRKDEYFLTDLVASAYADDPDSVTSVEGSEDLLIGVNDRVELEVADGLLRDRKRGELIQAGVTLLLPSSSLIDLDVQIGLDTIVGPGCVIEKGTSIGSECRIGPHSVIRGSEIGDRVRIESSTVEFSSIGDDSDVGPYSHLRAGAELAPGVHVGNFAEIKNAALDSGVRIGHFSYIGDASLGEDVNIGAGTVTCNFDGVDKHRTEIGAGAFIGSDSMLIAPISIGAGARTGAGAVVTKDVPDGGTVVGMPARQVPRSTAKPTQEGTA